MALIAGAGWALWGYAQHAEAFRIAAVMLPADSSLDVPSSLIGRNLWDVDLQALAEDLKRQEPWLKTVRVVRQLPDTVRVEVVARVPVAEVRIDHQWYPIDEEAFIFPRGRADIAEGLARVTAAARPGRGLVVGRVNRDEHLALALRVLQALRRAPALMARHITEVNVENPEHLRFVMDGTVEVRCGSEAELPTQLRRLRETLRALSRQQMSVAFIDVTAPTPFVEPAVSAP